jgi:magnesium transporter
MSDHRFYHVSPAGKLVTVDTLEEGLAVVGQRKGFLWLDYCQPTVDELMAIAGPLNLHPLAIEDCIDEEQIPKIEDFPHNTFIIFNAFVRNGPDLAIYELDLFIGADFVVSVNKFDAPDGRLLARIERLVERGIESAKHGPAFLMHAILDYVVDQKLVAIEALEDQLEGREDAMLDDLDHFDPADLLHLRRDLLAIRKSLFHEREILVRICRKDCPFIGEKAIYNYRDVSDHLTKFFELTETSRDIVNSLMEMYLSMLNNRMAKSANETNATVRRLTYITTIFMPLTMITGALGMSEFSMMVGPENWRIAYPLFFIGMALLGVASYYFLRWLERTSAAREAKRV